MPPLSESPDPDQPDIPTTPTPPTLTSPLPSQQLTSSSNRHHRGNPTTLTPLTPPPTQLPGRRLPFLERPSHKPPPSPLCRSFRLAYVAIPSRTPKRPLPSGDTSSETSHDNASDVRENAGVWALDGRHPEFLHKGEEFLLNVPGGNEWWSLLSRYTEFEGLTPTVSFKPCLLHYYITKCPDPRKTFNILSSQRGQLVVSLQSP